MENILEAVETGWEKGLGELVEFLRIPSVSGDPALSGEVARCAGWLAEVLTDGGFDARVEETPGHPVVTAVSPSIPGAPTLLVYGHYDVQPAKVEDGWTTEPFSPVIKDGALFGRGASDDKGQLFCHVLAARALAAAEGRLPVNLKFVFEGEEESGSTHLEAFLQANAERFAADAIVVSDTSQFAHGRPALTYGLRGLLCMEVTVRGANRDLHSGSFGGAVANPANALAMIIAALKSEDGRVSVPGFYKQVRPISDAEWQEWDALGFDEPGLAASLGVEVLPGEIGHSVVERMWARPTFDVNGLWSGYQGDGPKTVIPSVAGAKISFRLVPDQEPEKIADAVERYIQELCPPGVRLEVKRQHGARPVLLPRDGKFIDAAREAVREAYGVAPVMIREGGSIPVVETLSSLFSAPVALMGFGWPDDRAHGPDERFNLAEMKKGVVASALLMKKMGG